MDILSIIAKKRDGNILIKEEIDFFIKGYVDGSVTDYQAAALIMAIYIQGMNKQETVDLTMSMVHSGEMIDLSEIGGTIVDKHSTGGIGDKVTLILAPMIAALGIPMVKMSGRGLGITGGTIDKLEAIPGFDVNQEISQIIENVKRIGINLSGQTGNLVPADKKIYALRDTINCVGSMPLIASSVMSKKIAAGADKIVLDVTCGSGAFMKTEEEAIHLATSMQEIGDLAGRETLCVITNMSEPLGRAVGNSLEIIETIEALKGNMAEDVEDVVFTMGSYIIKLAGFGSNLEENKENMKKIIASGEAYQKFLEVVKNQKGDVSYIENPNKFEQAKYVIPLYAKQGGFIKALDAEKIGTISLHLGAGRIRKEDAIDFSAGVLLEKKTADYVEVGDVLGYLHTNKEELGKQLLKDFEEAYTIVQDKVEKSKHILKIV